MYAVITTLAIAVVTLPCHDVIVWSSDEKFSLMNDIASRYPTQTVDRRCAKIVVKRVPSGDAETALANESDAYGALPAAWTPAAQTWALLLVEHRREGKKSDIVPSTRTSLMQSPLVIAMPEQMYAKLKECRFDIGWKDILELVEDPRKCISYSQQWGRFRLAKTNPLISTSGLHALLTTYSAAIGQTGKLRLEDVQRADVSEFVRSVEQSVVHYASTVRSFLEKLYAEDEKGAALNYVSAIAVEEKQVFDYNHGFICEAPCTLPPREKLVAVYPAGGTLVADHPYMVLNAPWVDDVERRAAQLFLDYLGEPQNQALFLRAGFRDQNGQGDADTLRAPYFDVNEPRVKVALSEPAVLAEMQRSWSVLRKPANLLLLYDVGSSMGRPSARNSKITKLDQLAAATIAALSALRAESDAVGLWAFPSTPTGQEVVPISPLSTGTLVEQLKKLAPVAGDRRLVTALRGAADHVRTHFDADRINAVVLVSDGPDVDPGSPEFDRLLTYLRGQSEDERVRVFTISFDQAAVLPLRQIALGSKGFRYSGENVDMQALLRDVISNF